MASIVSAGTTSATALNMSADTSGVLQLASNNGTVAVTVDAAQNVGIGTSSPGAKLQVGDGVSVVQSWVSGSNSGTGGGAFTAVRNGSSYIAALGNASALLGGAYSSSPVLYFNGGLQFSEAGAERARIDSGGNLLVGTTSRLFSLSATLQAAQGANGQAGIFQTTGAGTAILFQTSTTGGVGSITTTTSTTAYNTSSDYRLKENIQPMTGALAKVAALKPVTYTWKADGSAGEGFIAHELAEVCPQAVTGEKDAVDAEGNPQYQGIDVSFLVGTLTAALQEAHGLIKNLETRLAALEGAK